MSVLPENDSLSAYGLVDPYDYEVNTNLDNKDRYRQFQQYNSYRQVVDGYSDGLAKRGKDFRGALGTESAAPAWVTNVDGEKTLCISLPLAEKILYKEEVTKGSSSYSDNDFVHDMAMLEHEYVHSQEGMLDPKLSLDFGISLEERRAEYFSGDKHGYTDAKSFLNDVGLLTGEFVQDVFDNASQKGRNPSEVVEAYANQLGLSRLVELLAVMPSNYNKEQTNSFRSSINEHLGGYDGVLRRIYDDKVVAGEKPKIDERITARMKRLVEINPDFWTAEEYENYRTGYVHTDFLTDELVAELAKQQAERKQGYKDKLKTIQFVNS
jgi:hypothetical protein